MCPTRVINNIHICGQICVVQRNFMNTSNNVLYCWVCALAYVSKRCPVTVGVSNLPTQEGNSVNGSINSYYCWLLLSLLLLIVAYYTTITPSYVCMFDPFLYRVESIFPWINFVVGTMRLVAQQTFVYVRNSHSCMGKLWCIQSVAIEHFTTNGSFCCCPCTRMRYVYVPMHKLFAWVLPGLLLVLVFLLLSAIVLMESSYKKYFQFFFSSFVRWVTHHKSQWNGKNACIWTNTPQGKCILDPFDSAQHTKS